MKAPLSWLKDFVEIDVDVNTLCARLVAIGFEVEEVVYLGKNIENVVVGKITGIKAHPNADKLLICDVDTGKKTAQIITGATNVFKGAVVPVALDGAVLPCGKKIKTGELRGEKSEGMLCSGEELCITDDNYPNAGVDGILILDAKEEIGKNIIPVLGLDDYVLDISVTANRPDCQSILGLAREVAVALGKPFKQKKSAAVKVDKNCSTADFVKVSVEDTVLCPTFLMSAVKDVKVAPSPLWMRRRLAAAGLRGISNIVDITNYVLIEMGQPMHAFDCESIEGGEIIARRAKQGEKIVPFDEKEYTLDSGTLVIADKNRATGLAGIMGGRNSGITSKTKTVLFECAKFNRESIRRSSRKLGLRSDASARFEKGVDSYNTFNAINRAMGLVNELKCGRVCGNRFEFTVDDLTAHQISFPLSEIDRVLGIDVPVQRVKEILNTLGLKTQVSKNIVSVTVPPYRRDIERPCDVIEEIIRVYGYDKIENTLLASAGVTKGGKTEFRKMLDKCKTALVGLGFSEAVSYSFFGKGNYDKLLLAQDDIRRQSIKIMRPLGEELSIMRTTLVPGMLNALSLNQSRGNDSALLFEVGKVYLPKELPLIELPEEKYCLCIGIYGKDAGFLTLKETVDAVLDKLGFNWNAVAGTLELSGGGSSVVEPFLHPGVSAFAAVEVGGCYEQIGCLGQVHPVVQQNFNLANASFVAVVDLDELFKRLKTQKRYSPIAKFPSSQRDLSIVVDENAPVGAIVNKLKSVSEFVESVSLFDVYRGGQVERGKKSVSLSVKLRSHEKTLSDVEIESVMLAALKKLGDEFGAKLR